MTIRGCLGACLLLAGTGAGGCGASDRSDDEGTQTAPQADTSTATASTTELETATTGGAAQTGATTDDAEATDAPDDDGGTTGRDDGSCVVPTMASDLPGVQLVVTAETCTFALAEAEAGITVAYELVITEPLEGVFPHEYGSANCVDVGLESLLVSERLYGDDHAYCVCDKGLCPPWDPPEISLVPGTSSMAFEWEGHAWNGPSDTPTPYGDPFPPGTYVLELRAIGQWDEPGVGLRDFEVLTEAEIVLVP